MHAFISLARLINAHLPQQDSQIGEPFFSALERVCSIHANCRSLLRTQHQRAGLELMDLMSSYQETAYEHLCRSAACIRLKDASQSFREFEPFGRLSACTAPWWTRRSLVRDTDPREKNAKMMGVLQGRSATCYTMHASAISRSVATGGSRESAGGLGTRMRRRWTPCCSAPPQRCGSGLCSSSTAQQKLLAHATTPCFRGQCRLQAVFSSILSAFCISITICNHTKMDAMLSLRQQHYVASYTICCMLSMSGMSVQVYRGPDKGWRGRHAAADRDACT